MAAKDDDKRDKDKGDGDKAPAKGKKKLVIIAGLSVVLLLGGVGAFFALGGSKEEQAAGDGEAQPAEEGEGEGGGEHGEGAAIMPLDTFIVNLQVKGSFLKTTIQLEFGTPEPPATAEKDLPKIRDAVIRVLTSKAAAEILTTEGKEKLRAELVDSINEALQSEDVAQVYFTEFIVQ